jgi:hypothetical protein
MKVASGSMMTFILMVFDMKEEELGQFLNWFLKYYSTSQKDGLFFYMNSMEKEVSIREIVDEYLGKIHASIRKHTEIQG